MLRTRIVAVILLVDAACTRGNPAFGDGTEGGTADDASTTRPTGDPNPSDPSDPSLTGSVESGETSATASSTDASDDAQDPTTTTDPDPLETGNPTTGVETCEVDKAPVFDAFVQAEDGVVDDPHCGEVFSIQGPVSVGKTDDEMIITVCTNDTCNCPDDARYTIKFTDLSPSPVAAIDNGANACVNLSWSRRSSEEGCGITWMSMETLVMSAQHPAYMASNVIEPDWGHLMPTPTLGRDFEICTPDACVDESPGLYSMFVGPHGPLVPGGEAVDAMFDPFTNGPAPYALHALFAQVDGDCMHSLGWAAIESP